jgi:hypothetical protein
MRSPDLTNLAITISDDKFDGSELLRMFSRIETLDLVMQLDPETFAGSFIALHLKSFSLVPKQPDPSGSMIYDWPIIQFVRTVFGFRIFFNC